MPADPIPPTRWALDDAVFGECRLGLDDFARAVRQEPRTRQLVQLATVLGALALPAGLWLLSSGRTRLGALGCGLGLLGFAAYHLPDQIARRWFAHTPPAARLVKYTLSERGLIVSSELSRQLHAYERLYGYQQVPDSFLIWISARLFVIVPKRAFAPDDVVRVSARLEQSLGAPPLLPRFWRWLALALLLAVLLLALWNTLSPR
jgi:hypothetical protein